MSARPISATAAIAPPAEDVPISEPLVFTGPGLVLARAVWFVVAVLASAVFVAGLPEQFASAQSPTGAGDLSAQQVAQLLRLGLSPRSLANISIAINSLVTVIFVVAGAVLFYRKSREKMAWAVALMMVAVAGIGFPPALQAQMATQPVQAIAGKMMVTVTISLFYWLFFIFPTGRFTPRWTIVPAIACALQLVCDNFLWNTPLNSWHWPPWLTVAILAALLPCPIVAQVYRFRRPSHPTERQQMKWLAYGMGIWFTIFIGFNVPLSLGVFGPPDNPSSLLAIMVMSTIFPLSFLCIPITLAIAIFRHRLFEIDVIISRTIVYTGLTLLVIGIYVLIVGYLGTALHDRDNLAVSLVATGIVAILFQPLRERLQRGVNRLLYGERDDPYAILSRLGSRLEETLAPDAVLPAVVETVASALKLPYVAIDVPDESLQARVTAAAAGQSGSHVERLPLTYGHDTVGTLLVAPRAPGEDFSEAERRILRDLARQAGVAVQSVREGARAARLAEDLQVTRQRLVTAREAERRRLRRDLHDGLGPRLASMSMRLETARDQFPPGLDGVQLLDNLALSLRETIADVRRLVYALRPPALDELGLIAALNEWAEQLSYQRPTGTGLSISIEPAAPLPPLPAAVEVAAYRIVQEAVTNVARHAQARRCRVCLNYLKDDDRLSIEVSDDGVGLPDPPRFGVGLASMHERADEIGGILTVEWAGQEPDHGTTIRAELPCRWDADGDERIDSMWEG